MLKLILIVATIALVSAATLPAVRVDTSRHSLVDVYGRTRFYHGINLMNKVYPYTPLADYSILDHLESFGFNFIRFGLFWRGVQPQPEVINSTYINAMNQWVQEMGNRNMYVLIDAHQDVATDEYGGDGFPKWFTDMAINVTNAKPFPYPIPANASTGWATYYFADSVSKIFQYLYQHPEYYASYWRAIASTFASCPYCFYELVNEPWCGDIWTDPLLLVPGVADKQNLAPFYKALNSYIREHDQNNIIFYEGITWDVFQSGFVSGPSGDPAYADRELLSYHVYCWLNGNTDLDRDVCELGDTNMVLERVNDAKRLNTTVFLSEFGWYGDADAEQAEFVRLMDMADSTFTSWSFWEIEEIYPNWNVSNPNQNKIKLLSRTYAQAVSGTPTSMSFNTTTAAFDLVFTPMPTFLAAESRVTEIFLQESIHYPNGYDVTIEPANCCTMLHNPNKIFVTLTEQASVPSSVHISIRAK